MNIGTAVPTNQNVECKYAADVWCCYAPVCTDLLLILILCTFYPYMEENHANCRVLV
jgi:hypothetical protein